MLATVLNILFIVNNPNWWVSARAVIDGGEQSSFVLEQCLYKGAQAVCDHKEKHPKRNHRSYCRANAANEDRRSMFFVLGPKYLRPILVPWYMDKLRTAVRRVTDMVWGCRLKCHERKLKREKRRLPQKKGTEAVIIETWSAGGAALGL